MAFFTRLVRSGGAWISAALISSCASPTIDPSLVTPTFAPKPPGAAAAVGPLLPSSPPIDTKERISPGPAPPTTTVQAAGGEAILPPQLTAEAESLTLEQVPLAAFITEVFSHALKLTVRMDQRVTGRSDLVTLRTGKPLPADDLYRMATKVLSSYGLSASWDGSALNIIPTDALMAQMPDIVRSRALPELPVALRPIFQVVDLLETSTTDMAALLSNIYGQKVRIFPATKANALLLFGLPEDVRAAVAAVQVLDQSRLAGRRSLRINPIYWAAPKLAEQLVTLLRAEGYDAASSAAAQAAAIMIIPIEANNSVIVLAQEPKLIAHVRDWITELDQPANVDPQSNIFVYSVRNTTAKELGQTVLGVLGAAQGGGAASSPEARLEQAGQTRGLQNQRGGASPAGGATGPLGLPIPGQAGGGQGQGGQGQGGPGQAGYGRGQGASESTSSATTLAGGTRLVVDGARNALIVVGSAQDYERIRPLMEKLDVPPLEVLVEVTVAELTLNDSTNLGVEWTMLNNIGNGYQQSVNTRFGIPSAGFNYAFLNGLGQVRLALNALAQNNHINVLSTPRILAKSGAEASIQVGTQVPIITSQATTNQIQTGGNSGVFQSVEYQQTGVLLTVNPTVHSGNRVDLVVSQEVSAALPNSTSGISSPQIQNRSLRTQLTLGDGQTVVIGGMIQDTRNDNDQGVPYLKDIPLLGLIFKSQSVTNNRTELLVFITPYVVSSDTDASSITKEFRDRMNNWAVPPASLQW